MKNRIVECIAAIEAEKDIKVLLACETGSRAWGFPSPDSDYDIRMIYAHAPEWYLSVEEDKDSIDMMLDDNELDISGWELRKSLRLLWKSNAALLERIQSPIIYTCNADFLTEVNLVSESFYSPIATMHHYLSMAKNCLDDVTGGDTYKLKKLFYGLRTATACKWILNKTEHPPIQFPLMLDGLDVDSKIRARIGELIALKSESNEDYVHSGEEEILGFMQACIAEAESKAQSLPASNRDMKLLDQLLRKYVAM